VKKGIRFGVGVALGALFIYLFINKLDWLNVWNNARAANLLMIAVATCLMVMTYVVRSLRWRALLAPMASPTWLALFRATTIGFTALFLLGRAGELIVRPAALSLNEPVKPSASYATVLIERVFDMVTVVILFALNMAFFEFSRTEPAAIESFRMIRLAGLFLLVTSGAGIYGLSVFRRRREGTLRYLDNKLRRIPERFYRGLMNLLERISEGLAVLHDAKGLAVTVAYTVALWLLVIVAYVLVIRAFGIPQSQIPYTGAVFVLGVSMFGSVVPTPGGATGPFHAATAAALIFLGVERNQAASTAIVLHLVVFLPAVFFGFFYILKEGITLARLIQPRSSVVSPTPGGRPARKAAAKAAATAGKNQMAASAAVAQAIVSPEPTPDNLE
jgi:uncharacterized protein (TIRG00374 family)